MMTYTSKDSDRQRPSCPTSTLLHVRVCVFSLLFLKACVGVVDASGSNKDGGGALSDVMFRTVFRGYESSVRPLCGEGYPSTTTVAMRVALHKIQELDDPKQILSTKLWLRLKWWDCRLQWNSSLWNVSRLVVPHSVMWTPDITLYDNVESNLSGVEDYRMVVTAEGGVEQLFPVVVNSVCQLDVTRFPFDTQACNLSFGSWAYHELEINLTEAEEAVDLSSYATNGQWEVLSFTVLRINPEFFGTHFPQLIFTLALRRRHMFYILSLLFPCALIQLMASLAFLLPCDTNEKVGLEITVLLSLAVMQLVIMDLIPASSETLPVIGLYCMLAMIVVSMSCLLTVVVLAVHYPNRHRPLPPWASSVLRSPLARCFRVDVFKEQQMLKHHDDRADPYVTTDASTHHRKSMTTNSNGPFSWAGDVSQEEAAFTTNDRSTTTTRPPHHDVINPYDVSFDDSLVSYSYSVEGERGKRLTYRPRSADVSPTGCYHHHHHHMTDPPTWSKANFSGMFEQQLPRGRKLRVEKTPPEPREEPPGSSDQSQEKGTFRGMNPERSRGEGLESLDQLVKDSGETFNNDNESRRESLEMMEQQPRREGCWRETPERSRREPVGETSEQRRREQQEEAEEEERSRKATPRPHPHPQPRPRPGGNLHETSTQRRAAAAELPSEGPPPRAERRRMEVPEEKREDERQWPRELREMVAVSRQILDCMRSDKKHQGGPGKKMARREWELMAQLLDRIFLLVFFILTGAMFCYVYASIV
ncbi:uncharacterized protein LOC143297366 [Babylonia areolata]|uniref:uncharacterized protein LOC143297366 n=1 Tax=Babylonia areolata TaxID=304850 RepID=UPI003FD65E6F